MKEMYEDKATKIMGWVCLFLAIACLAWLWLLIGAAINPGDRIFVVVISGFIIFFGGIFLGVRHGMRRDKEKIAAERRREAASDLAEKGLEPELYELLTSYAKGRRGKDLERLADAVLATMAAYLRLGGSFVDPDLAEVIGHVVGRVLGARKIHVVPSFSVKEGWLELTLHEDGQKPNFSRRVMFPA